MSVFKEVSKRRAGGRFSGVHEPDVKVDRSESCNVCHIFFASAEYRFDINYNVLKPHSDQPSYHHHCVKIGAIKIAKEREIAEAELSLFRSSQKGWVKIRVLRSQRAKVKYNMRKIREIIERLKKYQTV